MSAADPSSGSRPRRSTTHPAHHTHKSAAADMQPAGSAPETSHGSETETESGSLMQRMAHAASCKGVLLPSPLAFHLLLVVPPLLWCAAIMTGMAVFDGVPDNKKGVLHVMAWFDVAVFRTWAGPALPFMVLILRWIASAGITTGGNKPTRGPHDGDSSSKPIRDMHDDDDDDEEDGEEEEEEERAAVGRAVGGRRGGRPRTSRSSSTSAAAVAPTLIPQVALVYVVATLARMVLYAVHLVMQWRDRQAAHVVHMAGGAWVEPVAYLSDHILLGAAVAACLHSEVVCALSDCVKLTSVLAGAWREMLASACALISLLLYTLVTLDMHFTARLFHHPAESTVALLAGLLLFQIPLLVLLKRQWMATLPSKSG